MRISIVDNVIAAEAGPGAQAQFSAPNIEWLREAGHEVMLLREPDPVACRMSDVVWTEWCDDNAYKLAAWGVCNRLVIRVRGFDVWGPLDQLSLQNVYAIVFESENLRKQAFSRCRVLEKVRTEVIASGVDLRRFPFCARTQNKILAMAARADWRKGFQTVVEYARRRPDVQIHLAVALPESNPRLMTYLKSAPKNVVVHPPVFDVAEWFDQTQASYLLSASPWEDVGYTIVEGMACGLAPLVYDFPGVENLWPGVKTWRSFEDLDAALLQGSDTSANREFVEKNYDRNVQSKKLESLLLRDLPDCYWRSFTSTEHVISLGADILNLISKASDVDVPDIEALASTYCASRIVEHLNYLSSEIAFAMSKLYGRFGQSAQAVSWALRAMREGPRADAMVSLGMLTENRQPFVALSWYDAAAGIGKGEVAQVASENAEAVRGLLAKCRHDLKTNQAATTEKHMLAVHTSKRKHPTLERTLKSLDTGGALAWEGPRIVIGDGCDAGVFPHWKFERVDYRDHALTMLHTFRKAVDLDMRLTVFEDDIVVSVSALKYMNSVEMDDLELIFWYTPMPCLVEGGKGMARVPSKALRRTQAVTYSVEAMKTMLRRGPSFHEKRQVKHGPDEMFSLLEGFSGVMFPNLVQHIGYESGVGPQEAPPWNNSLTFAGETFDALTLWGDRA